MEAVVGFEVHTEVAVRQETLFATVTMSDLVDLVAMRQAAEGVDAGNRVRAKRTLGVRRLTFWAGADVGLSQTNASRARVLGRQVKESQENAC